MKILGLDSSGIVASVAIVEDDVLIAEYTVNYKKTHSQTLLPMLDEIAKMTELDLNSIDAIVVAAATGLFYRTANRLSDSERTRTCLKETSDRHSYCRGTGIQSV